MLMEGREYGMWSGLIKGGAFALNRGTSIGPIDEDDGKDFFSERDLVSSFEFSLNESD